MLKIQLIKRNCTSFINEISKPTPNISYHGDGVYSIGSESYEDFFKRVADFADIHNTTNIQFIDLNTAIITYVDNTEIFSTLEKTAVVHCHKIIVKRNNVKDSTIGLEPYEDFKNRVIAISYGYQTYDIEYLDNDTAIIKYYV